MEIIIKNIVVPENKRIIAISDIHGHYIFLKELLKKVSFTSDDILFIVGDIIEKGPESLKTLRYVMELCKKYTVYPLIGNVDASAVSLFDDSSEKSNKKLFDYIVSRKKWWGACIFSDMCCELNIKISSPDDIVLAKEALCKHFSKEFEFIRSLPTLIETQNFIFVHGGLPSNDLKRLEDYGLFEILKVDEFMNKGIYFDKYVIVGHWPVSLYNDKILQSNPIVNTKQKIISIDGGCGLKDTCQQLNALIIPNIHSTNFTYDYYDDFSIGYANTAQQESVNSINIRWNDSKIKILEKGNEISTVMHNTSGKIIKIPNKYISDFSEDACCNEYTDYYLNINVGDKLSIVDKFSNGYFVKKHGVNGWYNGEIVFSNTTK